MQSLETITRRSALVTGTRTLDLLRAARSGDDTIAAIDHLLALGYSYERARAACAPYKRGRYRATCGNRRGWHVEALTDYALAVESGLEGLHAVSTGTCPGCADCAEAHGFDASDADSMAEYEAARDYGTLDEASFSWSPCGICGCRLGGDRYFWHAIRVGDESREILHFDDACTDCVYYLANGDEPENWRRS